MADPMTTEPTATSNGTMTASESHYFNSYAGIGIHEEMLKDSKRSLAYRDAIYQNKHLLKGKVVLDVGCGTGILSMFCARAGAAHVIAVDFSSIIEKAREIVAVNGFADKITLIQGKIEEVQLPFPKVDIIVSEWMGYNLLYESMMNSVLWARDQYLVPGGLIFPDKVTMFLAGIEDGEYKDEKINFWDSVYGFDYSPMKNMALKEPLVDVVEFKAVVTDPAALITFDLNTVKVEDLAFEVPFNLPVRRTDLLHALVLWWDCEFSACHKPIKLSTGPHSPYTHWKQTVYYLTDALTVEAGEKVSGKYACKPNSENPRDLDITIGWDLQAHDATRSDNGQADYRMC